MLYEVGPQLWEPHAYKLHLHLAVEFHILLQLDLRSGASVEGSKTKQRQLGVSDPGFEEEEEEEEVGMRSRSNIPGT